MNAPALLQTSIPGPPAYHGKVRDIYEFGEKLLLVASDRISAYDWVMPNGIPDKGRVLTKLSEMWFERLGVPNHLLSMDVNSVPLPEGTDCDELDGRSMVVRKTEVVPIECVVRGYLSGSGWKEYQASGEVCSIPLPSGLRESDQLPEPIFTPATKATEGHDMNISFEEMCGIVGDDLSERLRSMSFDIYNRAAEFARTKGIIVADTKFEFGQVDGEVILIDEVVTPDSSRFWPADQYQPGGGQPSFDKQFVRDWLVSAGWDKNSSPPALPDEIVSKTRDKYIEAYELLAETDFAWK